jgi:hypothetical protein
MYRLKAFFLGAYLAATCQVFGQTQMVQPQDDEVPMYISMNEDHGTYIYSISNNKLNLEYHDSYGTKPSLSLRVYDRTRKLVINSSLDKSFGLNHYRIDLQTLYSNWVHNTIYQAEMVDESGFGHLVSFRMTDPVKSDLKASIMVSPVNFKCGNSQQNTVEFYGEISGGRAPYNASWYVLNDSRKDFLYQPKNLVVDKPGKASKIEVSKNPIYYVVLYVKDACGNEDKQIVNVTCSNRKRLKKRINTLFLEQHDGPVKLPTL